MRRIIVFLVTVFFTNFSFGEDQFPKSSVAEQIQMLSTEKIISFKDLERGEVKEFDIGVFPILIYRRTEADMLFIDNYLSSYDLLSDKIRWDFILQKRKERISSISGPIEFALAKFRSEFPALIYRSLDKSYLVAIGMDPEFSCKLKHIDSESYRNAISAPSEAVFINICHGELYDAAGREITRFGEHDPTGKVLLVPKHEYIGEKEIKVGEVDFTEYNSALEVEYLGLSVQQTLWKACRFNDHEVVQLSLEKGADPNEFIGLGNVLDCAISYSNREIISLLLENDAMLSTISMDLIDVLKRDDITDLITAGFIHID